MSYLDSLPSNERMKIRKRLRSPEEYERLREKVKGPEDLEKQMNRSEKLAEAQFALETEKGLKEKARAAVEKDIREGGAEAVLEGAEELPPDVKAALEQGKFAVTVSSHPATHEDALVVVPEGNVREKLPIKVSFSDAYVAQLTQSGLPPA